MAISGKKLAELVLTVIGNVLIHQRNRWGPLLGHKRQYEGWWKAELAAALESWAWSWDLPSFGILPEAKPRDFKIAGAESGAVDLVVAPWDNKQGKILFDQQPRTWIELKERGTWWGDPAKALGKANHGLWTDLEKWANIKWKNDDVVVACQITVHDGSRSESIPDNWEKAFEQVAKKYPRYLKPCIVGYPLKENHIRWARIDCFTIHPR
jgi:hypothetical protein